MTLGIVYLLVGLAIGFLLKYESDTRHRKKRIEKRITHLKATAEDSKMKKYDDILISIRAVNESLVSTQLQQKKEVQ